MLESQKTHQQKVTFETATHLQLQITSLQPLEQYFRVTR